MSWERRVTRGKFEQHARTRLLLFLSVDMENSTRLKQKAGQAHQEEWLDTVVGFLEKFPTLYSAKVEEEGRRSAWKGDTRRKPWKILGDEMIFVLELATREDACREVTALRNAIEVWNRQAKEDKEKSGKLPVKGTGWLAGFPVANAALPMGDHEDYVGPSMDAGFRFAKLASPRRLVISVDLAWWLMECDSPMRIHFDGRETMKGLAEESGYPLLWLEINQSKYQQIENVLLGRSEQERPGKLKSLCEAFITEFGVPAFLPFLPAADAKLSSEYAAKLQAAREHLRNVYLITDDPLDDSGDHGAHDEGAVQEMLSGIDATMDAKSE